MSYLDPYKLQIGLLRYYKIQKMVRRWKKAMKNSRHRHNVLKEWITTEQNYINDLKMIIDKIEKPMIEKKLITEDQQAILFPNVDVIITLSTRLLEFLKSVENKWHCRNTQISSELITLYPFFRIYISYCNVFNKGQIILKDLRNNPTFKDIEKALPMDISSYLIKPVQRPPKYMLLLRDYQKHMKPQHIDYHKLTEAITKYHQVNEINNDAIAKQGRAEKMFYLEKLTGGSLLSSSRQFLGETKAYFQNMTVTLYRLTDLVLICTYVESKEIILKMIYLDGSSYVEIIPDGKYFDTYLFLCGKSECIHLNFFNKQEQNTFFEIMNVTINNLLEKQDERKSRFQKKYKPQVKVRVTLAVNKIQMFSQSIQFKIIVSSAEKRPLSSIKNDTIYNVKFHIPKPWYLAQYIFLRYSVIEQIQNYLKKKYPQLELPKLRPLDMGSYDQTKNSTKIIEFRKLAITEFLNVVFRNERIMSNPLFLIQKLNIQQNFWAYAIEDNKQNCSCNLCADKKQFNVDTFYEEKKYYLKNFRTLPKQQYCMKKYMNQAHKLLTQSNINKINTFQRILTWINYYQGRIDYSKIYKKKKNQNISIKIWFPNITTSQYYHELKVDSQTTVGDVMLTITQYFSLNSMDDFGLFLEYHGTPRLLDPDENITEVMMLVEGDVVEETPNGIISKLHKWGTDLLHGKKSRVYLRKYLFLSRELEKKACQGNLERYILVIEQIFYDVKNNKINLKKQELIKMVAYFISMKSLNRLQYIKKTNLTNDDLRLILPESDQSLIESSTWKSAVFQEISWIKQEISPPKPTTILYEKILKLVQNKESHKCFWFNATNYYPQTLKGQQTEVLIGVNFENFMVLDPKNFELLINIPLLELKYRITIYSIFIDSFDAKLRFDGRMLESLSKIIEKYKIYSKIFTYLEDKQDF